MEKLRKITANEARDKLNEYLPRIKLNEIYDGVRAAVEEGYDTYAFDLSTINSIEREIVLRTLEKDGYRLIKMAWGVASYNIFW